MQWRSGSGRVLAVAGSVVAMVLGSAVVATEASASASASSSSSLAAVPAAAAAPVTVDDATTGGVNRFAFTGAWKACPRCEPSALGGSFRYTSQVGATVTLRFTGRQATLYGFTAPNGGSATVLVDGRKVSTVKLARGKKRAAAVVYRTRTLKPGPHTLALKVVKGTKGGVVAVDKAVVQGVPKGAATAPAPTSSAVSITFDDGRADAFTAAKPVLDAAGLKATFYILSNGIGQNGYMTAEQLRQLAGEGHELGNHTMSHAVLTGQPAATVDAEFAGANKAIQAAAGVTPRTCAYPSGDSDATVRAVAAKYFSGCRTTNGGMNPLSAPAKFELKVFNASQTTTAAMLTEALVAAKKPGTWLIIVYHGVGTPQNPEDVTAEALTQQVQAVKASGIPVRPVAAVLG